MYTENIQIKHMIFCFKGENIEDNNLTFIWYFDFLIINFVFKYSSEKKKIMKSDISFILFSAELT